MDVENMHNPLESGEYRSTFVLLTKLDMNYLTITFLKLTKFEDSLHGLGLYPRHHLQKGSKPKKVLYDRYRKLFSAKVMAAEA
jgi:hypothetical protein